MNPISICQSIIVTIKALLQSKEFLEAHRLPNRFVRSSAKLSMLHIITYLFFTSKQSMSINLSILRRELPDLDFPDVSKQAVSKARQGILPSLFQSLFDHSVDLFYRSIEKRKKWRNTYNIFAIDGSRICIPSSKSNYQNYGEMFSKKNEKRRWSMALCSTIYDVCNDFIVHGLIKRYLSSERDAALKHCAELEKLGLFKDSILILDRGYYSEALFRFFQTKDICVSCAFVKASTSHENVPVTVSRLFMAIRRMVPLI